MSLKAVAAALVVAITFAPAHVRAADAGSAVVAAAPAVAPWNAWRAQYCANWGPNDFGNFAGALPRSPQNGFPDYHGECQIWGPYEATGSAHW